jgi:hypothetical protein
MRLSSAKFSGTLMDMGGRRLTQEPRERRGGISLPVQVWKSIDTITTIRTAALREMGGENTQSTSDELEIATKRHIKRFIKKYGPLPILAEVKKPTPKNKDATELVVGPSESKYVAKVAESMGDDSLDDLNDVTDFDDDAA